MKIMYCEYEEKEYKEITIKELENKLDYGNKNKKYGVFIISLSNVIDNIFYFSEINAYDY